MKKQEIKQLSVEGLTEKLAEYRKEHASLKFVHTVKSLDNPRQIREVRRTVARLATELTNRENQ